MPETEDTKIRIETRLSQELHQTAEELRQVLKENSHEFYRTCVAIGVAIRLEQTAKKYDALSKIRDLQD